MLEKPAVAPREQPRCSLIRLALDALVPRMSRYCKTIAIFIEYLNNLAGISRCRAGSLVGRGELSEPAPLPYSRSCFCESYYVDRVSDGNRVDIRSVDGAPALVHPARMVSVLCCASQPHRDCNCYGSFFQDECSPENTRETWPFVLRSGDNSLDYCQRRRGGRALYDAGCRDSTTAAQLRPANLKIGMRI